MARRKATYRRSKWVPGLTTQRPSTLLGDGEATSAKNVDLSRNTVRRRDGWASVGTLPSGAADVTGLHPYYFQTTKQLIAVAGQYVMRSTGGDFTTVVNNFVELVDVPARPVFQTLNNKCYIAYTKGGDVANQIASWDGTTFVKPVTGSPVSSMVIDYGNALWAAGDTSAPNRIRWSGLIGTSGTDTWPAANFIDLHPGDGDRITGLSRTINMLVVLKERSLHRITGYPPDDAALASGQLTAVKLDGQPGCVAPRTVSTNQQLVVWLNRRGLYAYNGSSVDELTADIRDFFDDADPVNIKYAIGRFVSPTEYLLSFPTSAGTKKMLMFSFRPSWRSQWTGLSLESLATFNFTQQGEKPVFGFVGGGVGRQAAGLDNGASVPWEYQTGLLPLGPVTERKTTRPGWIRGKAGGENTTVQFLRDFSTTGGKKSISWATSSDEEVVTRRVVATTSARSIEMKLSGTGTGAAAPEVQDVTIEYAALSI